MYTEITNNANYRYNSEIKLRVSAFIYTSLYVLISPKLEGLTTSLTKACNAA